MEICRHHMDSGIEQQAGPQGVMSYKLTFYMLSGLSACLIGCKTDTLVSTGLQCEWKPNQAVVYLKIECYVLINVNLDRCATTNRPTESYFA